MQGPCGPGSPQVEGPQEHPLPESEEILRRADGRQRTGVVVAHVQSWANVPVRADSMVHYTINSTVNGHYRNMNSHQYLFRSC